LPRLIEDLDLLDEPEAEANTSSYDNSRQHELRSTFDQLFVGNTNVSNGYQQPGPFNLNRNSSIQNNSIQANYKVDNSSQLEISSIKGD
jgi:hypothetical protein